MATLTKWNDIQYNHSDDFDAVLGLATHPFTAHGPTGTRIRKPEELMQTLSTNPERYPGFEGETDDLFVVGDRAVKRFRYRFPERSPERGNLQCGIVLYRFENNRIAEYWQVNLPNDADWN